MSRAERLRTLASVASNCAEVEAACMADFQTFEDNRHYWSWGHMALLSVTEKPDGAVVPAGEEGFRAVTEGVPRTFAEALRDAKWGEPARKEFNTLMVTGAICEIDSEVAQEYIKNHGADLVVLFPVYEEKIKDGQTVFKLRLVGDGRTHYHAGSTY
jgi:hypothetical protein